MKFHIPQKLIDIGVASTFKPLFTVVPAKQFVFNLLPLAISFTDPLASTVFKCKIEKIDINGMYGEWISRKKTNIKKNKVILYLHGGGFVSCAPNTHRIITSCLSKYAGCRVLAIDYSKAPTYKFPVQLDECLMAYNYLLSLGYKAENIAIAGDSAGGNLSLTTTFYIMEKNPENIPACVVAISPWTDLSINGPSVEYNKKKDKMIPYEKLWNAREWYAGKRDCYKHPLISPAFGDFANFPPLLIHAGENEVLLSDAKFLHKNAKEHGAKDVRLKIWKGAGHVFQMWAVFHKESRQALKECGAFIEEIWSKNN